MMEVAGVAICALVLILSLKSTRPELALLLSLGTGVVIFGMAFPYLVEMRTEMESMGAKVSGSGMTFASLMKVLGICFICQIAAELCRDAGETALGSKVELFGKVVICAMTVPVMRALLDTVVSLIP